MAIELKIPEVGESITEVEIGKWHKSEGETARKDEVLVEIETDKATQELPAPATGRLSRVLKKQGETAHVGDVIAIFEEGEAAPAPAGGAPAKEKGKEKEKPAPAAAAEPHVMPAARRLLEEHGLRAQDVQATGPGGRLLKEDVQRHIERAQPEPPPAEQAPPAEPTLSREETPTPAAAAAPAPSAIGERQEEVVPMTPLRRRIAQRLVQAQQAAAMLTTFNEA
ncbi:MAG TPA: biotin/lipoyl-containing protein, partial [Phycisphaeraceae bacterium]